MFTVLFMYINIVLISFSDDMLMEGSEKDTQTYTGIPPSITLSLAASKSPVKSKIPATSLNISQNLDKMEMKSNLGPNGSSRNEKVKKTLQELLECNHEMMKTVQTQLATQTQLLQTLMKLL